MNKPLRYSSFLLLSIALFGCNQLENEVKELEQEYGIEIHINEIGDRDPQTIPTFDREQVETLLTYIVRFKEEEQQEGHTSHYLGDALLESVRTGDEKEIPVDSYRLYLGTKGEEVDVYNLLTTINFYSDRDDRVVADIDAVRTGRGGVDWQQSVGEVIEATQEEIEFYLEGEWLGEFLYEGKILSFTEPNTLSFILTHEEIEEYRQQAINIDAVS
ncbi:hypothetical protein ACI2JA_10980 [Alkalihalobacillus sp. NPDC078783]